MKRQDFSFELPKELIAQYPTPNRSDARLLVYSRSDASYAHRQFKDILEYLEAGDLLVMNNTKVIPARLYGQKNSGGRVELLLERLLDDVCCTTRIKASKAPKPGSVIQLDAGWQVEIMAKEGELYYVKANGSLDSMLHEIGHIPLPPYIARSDKALDAQRYQTVYAEHKGSVAAPTAGLHFDEALLARLKQKGVRIAYTTLHVGAGTFMPMRCDNILEHAMHSERFQVDEALCKAVQTARAAQKRVIAVGTTALRSLESAAVDGVLQPCDRETDIFIYPGYSFQICDGLITNFHLPESTLLMLVSAFIGREQALELYRLAVKERYRFFSYGDASLLL